MCEQVDKYGMCIKCLMQRHVAHSKIVYVSQKGKSKEFTKEVLDELLKNTRKYYRK